MYFASISKTFIFISWDLSNGRNINKGIKSWTKTLHDLELFIILLTRKL